MPFIQEKRQAGPLLYLAVQFLKKKKKKPLAQGSPPPGKKLETTLSVPLPKKGGELQDFHVNVIGRYTESLQRPTSMKP